MGKYVDFKVADVITSDDCHRQRCRAIEYEVDGVVGDITALSVNFKNKTVEVYAKDEFGLFVKNGSDEVKVNAMSPESFTVKFEDGTVRGW